MYPLSNRDIRMLTFYTRVVNTPHGKQVIYYRHDEFHNTEGYAIVWSTGYAAIYHYDIFKDNRYEPTHKVVNND